ncbi:formyltransferase family protein [Kitasatospora sp. NBC_01287]|uniref:formyltransferase family protein n=1 Tax=Kitasatospora sp. NBC_01287 TaxID=2903573 RepID=UPI0022533AC1|nr:formyltransferase family protein [Kitasatospora sp. NBC_01287]MCX4745524.1 formyltransferase family protein [Kitasatospora sp. NBC_01287]
MTLRVAVLASHTGSNLRALTADAADPAAGYAVILVISNNSGSGALAHARELGIAGLHLSGRTHPDPAELDRALLAALRAGAADLVVTAGYLKRIGPAALRGYAGRIVNVHPALLPRHRGPGLHSHHVHRAVLAAGERVTGVSVHLLAPDGEQPVVLAARPLPVRADDTVESLARQALPVEHALLPATVRTLALAAALSAGGRLT